MQELENDVNIAGINSNTTQSSEYPFQYTVYRM